MLLLDHWRNCCRSEDRRKEVSTIRPIRYDAILLKPKALNVALVGEKYVQLLQMPKPCTYLGCLRNPSINHAHKGDSCRERSWKQATSRRVSLQVPFPVSSSKRCSILRKIERWSCIRILSCIRERLAEAQPLPMADLKGVSIMSAQDKSGMNLHHPRCRPHSKCPPDRLLPLLQSNARSFCPTLQHRRRCQYPPAHC